MIMVMFSWRGDTVRAMFAVYKTPLHDEGESGQTEAGMGGAHHARFGDNSLPLHHTGLCEC